MQLLSGQPPVTDRVSGHLSFGQPALFRMPSPSWVSGHMGTMVPLRASLSLPDKGQVRWPPWRKRPTYFETSSGLSGIQGCHFDKVG